MNTALSVKGDRFLINGKYTYCEIKDCPENNKGLLMNARFIQGVFDDELDPSRFDRFGKNFDPEANTDLLIEALPQWYAHGLRAFTVGLQGGGPCFTISNHTIKNSPYSPDGKSIDDAYLSRLYRLIEAADKIGMVVIVSLFYGDQVRFLKDDEAVKNAVTLVCNLLRDKGYTNLIIEIANEHDIDCLKPYPVLQTAEGMATLLALAREQSGGMPVGSSRLGGSFDKIVAEASDVIFIHGNGLTRHEYYQLIQRAKAIKPARPIVCNEDSQAISRIDVSVEHGASWGYYNNMTKQEPPTDWSITRGEDEFFAIRMAKSLGIKSEAPQDEYYLQGLEKNATYEGKRWIRLAALYPEKIYKVEFYRNGKLFETAYDEPFSIGFIWTWLQTAVENIESGEEWKAIIHLIDGTTLERKVIVE